MRRKTAREERIRAAHPKVGGLILALSDEPQSTRAWARAAEGEERLGQRLSGLAGPLVQVLHDRRIPRTRADIDHVVICPGGVFVVDAKRYAGRPRLRVEGGILRPQAERLLVGRRDCSDLVDGVLRQARLVRAAVGDDVTAPDVHGFLCFVNADWPLIGGAFTTREVHVLWPKKLAALVARAGAPTEGDIATLHGRLAAAFPAA